MHSKFNVSFLILFSCCALKAHSQVTLNEIMFDPSGNENTDEFIELYNNSLNNRNLSGWTISDGEGSDSLIALDQGLIVHPGQYVLVMDPDYFPSGSTTYDGRVPESALVVTISGSTFGSRGLSNSSPETVTLFDADSSVVSSYTYTIGNLPGRSEEKILFTLGDDSSNWADALVDLGTPGYRNSVTPPQRDLGITRMTVAPSAPQPGESFNLTITVSNLGLSSLSDSLTLYERSGGVDSLTLLDGWTLPMLAPHDSVVLSSSAVVASELPRYFAARLPGTDDNLENNSRECAVSPSGLPGSLIINEIMYAPEPGMSEWVELLNPNPIPISLNGFSFGDGTALADSTRSFSLPDMTLDPDSMLVLASDSAVFFEHLPPTARVLVWNSSSVSLNNNGDSLLLWNQSGDLIDRADYRPSWGGEQGISLERISSSASTNDPLNWASSLDSTGGTPARVNSRALPAAGVTDELLLLEPNPFSPDGDGRDDLLAVRINLHDADARVDLKIYDVRGREVRRLASRADVTYHGEILWDGRDSQGRMLPTGLYIVYLEALGRGGTRIQSARRVVALVRPS